MKIEVNGPEIKRDDGTVRCIGYGEDSEGRVTGRFALPQGHEWDAPDATQQLQYVDAMDQLPSIDGSYQDQP